MSILDSSRSLISRVLRRGSDALSPPRRLRRPRLSAMQMRLAAGAALTTAVDLLKDAELLGANGRHARSYAIGSLAVEELGKATLCLQRAENMPETDAEWLEFYEVYGHHRRKWRTLVDAILEDLAGQLPANAKKVAPHAAAESVRLRERAFYSEIHTDGRALTPRGLIDPGGLDGNVIAQMIAGARARGVELVKRLQELDARLH